MLLILEGNGGRIAYKKERLCQNFYSLRNDYMMNNYDKNDEILAISCII